MIIRDCIVRPGRTIQVILRDYWVLSVTDICNLPVCVLSAMHDLPLWCEIDRHEQAWLKKTIFWWSICLICISNQVSICAHYLTGRRWNGSQALENKMQAVWKLPVEWFRTLKIWGYCQWYMCWWPDLFFWASTIKLTFLSKNFILLKLCCNVYIAFFSKTLRRSRAVNECRKYFHTVSKAELIKRSTLNVQGFLF